jgi:predicted transcriptional regulator
MGRSRATEPITVRTAKQIVSEIDALAAAMDRSRNDVVNQALRHYLETSAWQVERTQGGPGRRP